jgi:hypothetical protein
MATLPPRSAVAELLRELERVHALHAVRAANPILAGALERLGDWQSRRLAATYADLAVEPRYAEAIAFFQDELYSGKDFGRRDADLKRIVPAMTRVLPAGVIMTVARAMELNALSHELDAQLLEFLPRAAAPFGVDEYCRAFRRAGRERERRRQVALIGEVGTALDRFVKRPMVRGALTLMRRPARLAGLDELQSFLELGFAAFHRIGGAAAFLSTIAARETAILDAIFGGSNSPFPEPPPSTRR